MLVTGGIWCGRRKSETIETYRGEGAAERYFGDDDRPTFSYDHCLRRVASSTEMAPLIARPPTNRELRKERTRLQRIAEQARRDDAARLRREFERDKVLFKAGRLTDRVRVLKVDRERIWLVPL